MKAGDRIIMTRGHYAGRPGLIRVVSGTKCIVTLTDTPGPADVRINNVTSKDYKKI